VNERDLREAALRVARGDAESFSVIVDASADRLFRLATRMLGQGSDAQEAVQEAYLRAFQALATGRLDDRGSVQGWLTRIVANHCIDLLRQRGSRPAEVTLEKAPRDAIEAPEQEDLLLRRDLLSWLDGLPAEQRAAVVLRHLEGMRNAEVAQALGTTEGAIEQRLLRARASLRKKIDDERR
jgi:RNA polymerase sigma-70 factor (ECF subfamily)